MSKVTDENRKNGYFSIKSKTKIDKLQVNDIIPASDLTVQSEKHLIQAEWVRPEEDKKIEINNKLYVIESTPGGAVLKETELRRANILRSVDNTKAIREFANEFFDNLHVYEQLGSYDAETYTEKARKGLLYSDPGQGKTATIMDFCHEMIKTKNKAVILWPTDQVDSGAVLNMLSSEVEYMDDVDGLVLVIEDIGGNPHEGHGGPRQVDSSLLELLSGAQSVFKVPTLVLATTNYPQNLLSALADRPERFDRIIELPPPSVDDKIAILEFLLKRTLEDNEKQALAMKKVANLSIAHLKEVAIRSLMQKTNIESCLKDMIAHKEAFNNAFTKKNEMGFGG